MHKVVEKLQKQEFVEQERKEQKALDEFAQRNNNRR
jgi:flagellar biosynthesis chaperone FliJ